MELKRRRSNVDERTWSKAELPMGLSIAGTPVTAYRPIREKNVSAQAHFEFRECVRRMFVLRIDVHFPRFLHSSAVPLPILSISVQRSRSTRRYITSS